MTKQLDECDGLLLEKAERIIGYKENSHIINDELWHRTGKSEAQLNERKENFSKIIELLHLSYIHNLNKTRAFTHTFIAARFSISNFLEMHDLFDMPVIITMAELSLPFDKDDIHDRGIHNILFCFFDDRFECRDELQKLSLDEINNNKYMLASIISRHMERRVNRLLREEIKSLKRERHSLRETMRSRGLGPNARLMQVEDTWVCCNNCGKFRMLPPGISREEVEALPDVWVCANNTWDPERSNCNAEERTAIFMVEYYERRRQEEEEGD